MKSQVTEKEQDMLRHGVSFQVLNRSYLSEGEVELNDRLDQEKTYEDHRSWHLFIPDGSKGPAGLVRAKMLYEIFHKECFMRDMPVKEVMMVDLLKMGNKKR